MQGDSEHPSLFPIIPTYQPYAWGLPGASSLVAHLFSRHSNDPISLTEPYAELWMGTHPASPSTTTLTPDRPTLQAVVAATPHPALKCKNGDALHFSTAHGELPFLLKILSIARPLSIQAHPNRHRAAQLHARFPDVYKDPNHKPEMCVALSDSFRAMCGFRPAEQTAADIARVPALRDAIGQIQADRFRSAMEEVAAAVEDGRADPAEARRMKSDALRLAFAALIEADADHVAERVREVVRMVEAGKDVAATDRLVANLDSYFTGDVGCFAPYFLNYLEISAGEAFVMPANEPHAYLSGECVEVMACSDNVVRVGLTPKAKDTKTLLDMLTYNDMMPQVLNGVQTNSFTKLYQPPRDIQEFQLDLVRLPKGEMVELAASPGPCLILVISGEGWVHEKDDDGSMLPLYGGAVYYLAPNEGAVVRSTSSSVSKFGQAGSDPLVLFKAGVNEEVITSE